MNQIYRLVFGLVFLSVLISSCKSTPEVVVHIDKDDFTIEDHNNIGQNLSSYIAATPDYYTIIPRNEIPEFYDYISTLMNAVVNTNMIDNRNAFDWEIIVLKDDNVRSAFSIPGGKIYVYTGMLKMIGTENELFSLLAHEIYSVERGAVLEAMKLEYGTLIVGDLVLGTESVGVQDVVETIHNLAIAKEVVTKADRFAVEMICPFQYEARGLKFLIERATNFSGTTQWLSTRPGEEGRINNIEAWAEDCGTEEATFMERYEYHKALLP